MRFLIKIAFLVGLVALFLPNHSKDGTTSDPGLSPVVLLYGVQQAFSDLGSFCDRSPAACATARDAASFVGARITEGAAIGYAMVREKVAGQSAEPSGIEDEQRPMPRAYTPPSRQPANGEMTTGALRADPISAMIDSTTTGRIAPDAAPRAVRPAPIEAAPRAAATALHPPQPYRQPVPAQSHPAAAPPQTAAIAPNALSSGEIRHVPGSAKPFRMPAMAGGAREALHPQPHEIVPPERAPLPRFAPRA